MVSLVLADATFVIKSSITFIATEMTDEVFLYAV